MRAYVAHGIDHKNPLSTSTYTTAHPVLEQPPTEPSVLVNVAYASVNPADIQYVNGVYEHAPAHPMPQFPCPLGVDGAGVVVGVGSKVTKFKAGDHVLGLHQRMDNGSWAEVAAFEEREIAGKPAAVCWQLAAAAPVAGVTALSALLCCPGLKAYYEQHSSSSSSNSSSSSSNSSRASLESVLILGASGGVGSFAVLLAKHFFRVPLVMATCSGRNAEYVRQLGANVGIDYTTQDVQAAVVQALQQQRQRQHPKVADDGVEIGNSAASEDATKQVSGVATKPSSSSSSSSSSMLDLVVDNVGGAAHMSMACTLLKPSSGFYVTSVPLANPQSSSLWSVLLFFAKLASYTALHCIAPARFPAVAFNGASPDGARLQRLVDWVAAANDVVHGSSAAKCLVRLTEYDLQGAGEALAAVQSKRVVGKLVLRVHGDL